MQEQLIIIYLQNLFKEAGCGEFGVPKKCFPHVISKTCSGREKKNSAPLPWNALHQQQSDIWNLIDIYVFL